jgi:hypothetical protein
MVPLVRGRCKIVLVPLTRRKSSHTLERLAMTGPIDPSHVTRLVDSPRRSLEQTGEPGHDVRLVGPPVVTARSRLYLLGRVHPRAGYVLKEPLVGDAAVDTDPPLSARAKFGALKLASAWPGDGVRGGASCRSARGLRGVPHGARVGPVVHQRPSNRLSPRLLFVVWRRRMPSTDDQSISRIR